MVSASVLVVEQRNKQCCAPVNLEFTSAYSVRGLAVTNCNGGPKLTHGLENRIAVLQKGHRARRNLRAGLSPPLF